MNRLQAIFFALALYSVNALALEPFVISDIRIDGLERIAAGTVFNYLPLEVGDRMDRQTATEAMRALFRTGFFEDINLEQQDDILIIRVQERPAISDIEIEGNKDIKTEDLERALADFGLAEGEVFQRITLDRIQQSLTNEYYNRGKYNVSIEADVQPLQRNRVSIDITISEGDAAKIKHINIVGNTVFEDEEILDDFESKTGSFLSWYTKDNQYSKDKLKGDLETLTSYYQDRGYVDFDIESTQVTISPDKNDIYVTANVREGDIYTVSEIVMTGEFILPESTIRQLVVIGEGQTFSRRLLEGSVDNITATLGNIGYAFANVNPVPDIDRETKQVKITLFVDPGKRVYVRRINFFGNAKTKDEVLRREMRQFEGGWFSQFAVERSRLRLQRLPYIEELNIETPPVPGTDDQVDVMVTVKERTAGSFTFGLGFSQTSGLLASFSVSQENFLGSGKQMGLSFSDSSFFTRFDLSYVNPYYTDDGVSRGFNFKITELDQGEANIASYLADTVAVSVNYGIPLTEVDRVRLLLGAEDTEITPFSGSGDEITEELEFYGDSLTTYRGELLFSRDSRNRFFNPTSGSVQRVALEVALPGSTVEYYKLSYNGTKYFPITRRLTASFSTEVGYGDSFGDNGDSGFGLPFYEHFFAGGVRSVRGYEDNTLGPRTSTDTGQLDPETGEPLIIQGRPFGGDLKVTGKAELAFPVPFMKKPSTTMRLSWFLDFGQVYENLDAFDAEEIRYTTGIALQWQAPVGPIVINFAIPLNDKDGDQTEGLQFAFGNFF
jgi:outer membrane protein insertion porin family